MFPTVNSLMWYQSHTIKLQVILVCKDCEMRVWDNFRGERKTFRTPHKYMEYRVVVISCKYISPTWKNNISSVSKDTILPYFSAVDSSSVTCWERGAGRWPARGRSGCESAGARVQQQTWVSTGTLQLLEAAPLHQWPHLTRAAGSLQHCWSSKNRTEEQL